MAHTSTPQHDLKWAQMTRGARLLWVGRFVIALMTFGFAFPRIMEPHLNDERQPAE